MGYLIINWLLSSASLLLVASLAPGFRVTEFESAIVVTGIVGLMSAILGTALKQASGPVSAGISWALLLIANALFFRVIALLVPGFAMRGFLPAVAGALVLLLLNLILLRVSAASRAHHFDSRPLLKS